MALELRRRAIEFLASRPEERFRAREIAEWICANYPTEVASKKAASSFIKTDAQMLYQLVAEIGSNRPQWEAKHSQLRTTEGDRPRLYYWTEKSEADEVEAVESQREALTSSTHPPKLREHDLYPLLVTFLETEQSVQAKRIDEKKSSNTSGAGGNRWLFPDVVGVEDLTAGLNSEVKAAIRESRARRIRLWSFEVKILINRSNARETYFQAVSNSSWANFGYLVAADIVGDDTLKEIRILYAMHGIGLIKLDAENPSESQILIPARERTDVEWEMCSRLANENKDFKAIMTQVRKFFQTGDLH
jgi:uncharacterized protein